jgi:hypothetical protein
MRKCAKELIRTFSKEEVQMAKKNKHEKIPSLFIRKMQIKTTLRFHHTSVRISKIKNTNNKCW